MAGEGVVLDMLLVTAAGGSRAPFVVDGDKLVGGL